MKNYILIIALTLGVFIFSAHSVAAQCTTTVTGNSGDDPVYIISCSDSNTSVVSVSNRARARFRNRTNINGGANVMAAAQDLVGGSITVQGSSLTQTFTAVVGQINITF